MYTGSDSLAQKTGQVGLGMHVLIVTENVHVCRAANFIKSATPFFSIHYPVQSGFLWMVQTRLPTPLARLAAIMRHALAVLRFRTVPGRKYCYLQDLDVANLVFCKIIGLSTVLDAIEPFSIAAWGYPFHFLWGRPWLLWRAEEALCYRLASVLLVVCPEYGNWVKEQHGVNPIVVENFPDIGVFTPSGGKSPDFSVVYFGGDSRSRSLAAVEGALKSLKREIPIKFMIIGPRTLLRGLTTVDEYFGYLPDAEAAPIISRCHVGVAPYLQTAHAEYTIPNKTFQYAACNVLTIEPHTRPMQRFSAICRLLQSNEEDHWARAIREAYEAWRVDPQFGHSLRDTLLSNRWTSESAWRKCIDAMTADT